MHTHPTAVQNLNKKDQGVAKKSFMMLDALSFKKSSPAYLSIENEKVELPKSAVKLLLEILNQLAEGNALTLIPQHAHLTSQEGANLLNVSRPFFVKLLESGEIPYQKIGNRRRVLADDVIKYKEKIHKARVKTLQDLVEQAQDLDMGY